MQNNNDAQLRELAHKRVAFRAHLLSYCVVMAPLWIIWYVTGHGYIWPVWPTVGWGIGLIFHYIFDYRYSSFLSEEEEYERIRKEIDEREHMAH